MRFVSELGLIKTEEEDVHLPSCYLIASAANQRPDDFNLFGH